MFEEFLHDSDIRFHTNEQVRPQIRRACQAASDLAEYKVIGKSEAGRLIDGVVLGEGSKTVVLLAGAHSDEPAGPETLRLFILKLLEKREKFADLLRAYKFVILPHVNPDGEVRNQKWIRRWPGAEAYLAHAFREAPGRDIEFGYPEMRAENQAVSAFLRAHAPVALYVNLHGMGFAEGAMLLIERHWTDRTVALRRQFAENMSRFGLGLHDHDRQGEKGFQYIEPGFTTTPEGAAMRAYFESIGEPETATLFGDSSMEYVRKCGGDPLCLVTELPLFLIHARAAHPQAGVPQTYLDFREKIPSLKMRLSQGKSIKDMLDKFQIRPLDLRNLVALQLHTIALGLRAVSEV